MAEASSTAKDAELRELTLRAREGDAEAAYALLAEQVPVDAWVAALGALERVPDVDLEVVAHRTLRRKPVAVPIAVLALARAVGTAQAAFVARVISVLRAEEHIITDASAVAEELAAANDPVVLLADDRPSDALYSVLARTLPEQATLLRELGADEVTREALIDAARDQYERLQTLSRDTRWRSGSYRHALRHAIADLALIASAGGRLEDQAFRLLQQRTEDPAANTALLSLLPPPTRKSYLEWVIGRPGRQGRECPHPLCPRRTRVPLSRRRRSRRNPPVDWGKRLRHRVCGGDVSRTHRSL